VGIPVIGIFKKWEKIEDIDSFHRVLRFPAPIKSTDMILLK